MTRDGHFLGSPPPGRELTLREAAERLDAAMRDGSYRRTPIGRDVARFVLYLGSARDASPRTVDDYERLLARFAVEHAHLDLPVFEGAAGAERILEFVARHWGDASPGTRRKAFAVLSSFFEWAVRFDHLASNPVRRIDRPRKRGVERHAHHPDRVKRIIGAQPDLRDRVAIALLARLGLRKNELRLLRWRDVDLAAGELRVMGKGRRPAIIPIVYEDMLGDLARLSLDGGSADHFLLFPTRVGNVRHPDRRHMRGVVQEYPERPMQPSTMHRWWVRCLRQAGTAHFPMHELRHTAGTEFMRATGNLELTKRFMRHASITTTSEAYMHLDRDDLVAATKIAADRWDAAKE